MLLVAPSNDRDHQYDDSPNVSLSLCKAAIGTNLLMVKYGDMINERIAKTVSQKIGLMINDQATNLLMVDSDPSALLLQVDDIGSRKDITEAAKVVLQERYWFLNQQWRHENLKERFNVKLANHEVEIFVFGREIDTGTKSAIIKTLESFYNRLKDTSSWNLESIQIIDLAKGNLKNGELLRGLEFPKQHRIELYPMSLEKSKYREELECSELEGTLTHEIAHIVLEETLVKIWEDESLGWKITEPSLIKLPGGNTTPLYNEHPEECPTSYASLQPNDDRAESVVAYLFDPNKLSENRKKILNNIFANEKHEIKAETHQLATALPELATEIPITVSKRANGLFGSPSVTSNEERKIINLSDFRKQHGIIDTEL